MKNLLVYLHGKGSNENSQTSLVAAISDYFDADILTINAPFKYDNGYMWFHKENEITSSEDFNYSLKYVKEIISKVSNDFEKIIFLGHSQGGVLAISLALSQKKSIAISVCGDIPKGIIIPENLYNTPIYWFEAQNDEYLSKTRKDSYINLQQAGYNIQHSLIANSSHSKIDINNLYFLDFASD